MHMDTPIACILTPGQYRDRTADFAALARDGLVTREPTDGGQRLTFARSDEMERRLEAAIVAEAACCPFLTFDLERRPEHLVLDIRGPEDAKPVIAELFV